MDLERFMAKIVFDSHSECWLWSGYTTPAGYGRFKLRGRAQYAHRVAWKLHYGLIPNKLYVLHKCDVSNCVNPDHLFLGTPKDNMLDRDQKGRNGYSKRTHCPRGHPYIGKNLYTYANGWRQCRACIRQRRAA